MLQRVPAGAVVFVLGLTRQSDLAGLLQACELSDAIRRLVFVGPRLPDPITLPSVDTAIHWPASVAEFLECLDSVEPLGEEADGLLIRVRAGDMDKSINLATCVDRSHPITSRFELVSIRHLLDGGSPTLDALRAFLAHPAGDWRPYASGIPYPRHAEHRRVVLKYLARFSREGPAATETIWLQAEDGSGATTAVRQLAFDLANAGHPVLVARADALDFDFHQLATFLTRAGDRFVAEGVSSGETPWTIVFDAQHTQLQWEFVTGVASGLKRLQRSAIVLAVRPYNDRTDDARRDALGSNQFLRPPLRNSVDIDEAVALGEHFDRILPPELRRTRSEWEWVIADTLRVTSEGTRSLFWVALRFWLLRVPGSEEHLHTWLRRHLDVSTAGRPDLYAAVLETAALSKHRLEMPQELLASGALRQLRTLASEDSNLLGLIVLHRASSSGFAFAHSLTAEELLRLASRDDSALTAVGMPACLNAFDLELHVLERIITRDVIGGPVGVRLVEELVTSALRVDPFEAPRNYQERDRIVRMLERVPDAVWDDSQIFNHHVAKARRHLALDPPDASWHSDAVREQLELAENHLLDAIDNIRPSDDGRRESSLNLRVSLALTYDARAKHEHRTGHPTEAERFRAAADAAYRAAQRMDSDNSYVLENFARFKLNQQMPFVDGEERIRLVVDAISLLEWELQTDQGGRREEPILFELANAYDALEKGDGRSLLVRLAQNGSEPALVALAKLAVRIHASEAAPSEEALSEAERLLRAVPVDQATSRSIFALYRVISRRRPLDFAERLELLVALEGDPDFSLPLQIMMELGILLFQIGETAQRRRGESVFRHLRDQLGERGGALHVPDEMRFLGDPAKSFSERLLTSIFVRNLADGGRNYFGVPHGWGTVQIPMRVHDFGPNLRHGSERDCFIRFTNFGPQAVPPTVE
ncbi:MAG: hypothetical protein ABS52_15480 [Gemmatimonadetes bacterium SCN 70-22]|nr:MAG: hypothetical protein ABS52_15480 [Gemmatimonadetes bacterium SCN 70-22]